MTMFASGDVMAQLSQESHLLSPEFSAVGSDNGQLEELKGETFFELVETERLPLGKESEAEAAAAASASTPSNQQRATLKTPSSPVNPGTCSISSSKPTRKSNTNHLPATQQSSKSNNVKMSSKWVPSASRRAIPIKIQIVRPAPPPPSSSSSTKAHKTKGSSLPQPDGDTPVYSFTMTLLPMTKIRELCLHAAGHARRHLDAVLDGSRFEARDRDGHVFEGHETMSEEILSGETLYLIDGGLDARGAAKGMQSGGRGGASEKPRAGGRGRGRLLCLDSLELEGEDETRAKTSYRTPSVSSRASSSRAGTKEKEKVEPKMTPSQKALAIAQMGRTPRSEQPVVERTQTASSVVRRSLPSPALDNVEEAGIDNLEANMVASALLRSSSPPPQPQPEIPSHLKDSQLVIQDSQDPFSQDLFSQQSIEHQAPLLANTMPVASDALRAQSRPSPRVKTTHTSPLLRPTSSTSRPDPYDIDTVLSDNDGIGPDARKTATKTKMSSSVRRLGSATNKRQAAFPPTVLLPSPRLNQSSEALPSRADKAAAAAIHGKASTPKKKRTPMNAEHSSPAVLLPSSPTHHVAAAIAKSGQRTVAKKKQSQLPDPRQVVIDIPSDSDSNDALIDEVFRDLSGSAPAPSLPWSAPPLRAGRDDPIGTDLPARRRGSVSSTAGEPRHGALVVEKAPSSGTPKKSPGKKSIGLFTGNKSSQKIPARKPIIQSPSKKEEATIIHDSSSAEESNEEDAPIIKREPSSEEDISYKAKLAAIPATPEKTRHFEKTQPVVVEISSGSDSDIEPSTDMLEHDEAELPSIDFELLAHIDKLASPTPAVRSPAPSIKPEPAHEEHPPSAQPSKRKRLAIEEPDSEDEKREKKKLKRELRKQAKKARKERKRAKNGALQDERERESSALQEKRKKLALDQAHRRALQLEIVVSSPIKRESSITPDEDADNEDSGLGSSAYGDDANADVGRAGVPLDGDDKNDSLSSKEAEDHHPSWRELSKRHLSSSPQGSQNNSPRKDKHHLTAPPTSTPAIIEAQLQQCVEERFHRMPFDDWAFLESTLGRSLGAGSGYSPLEVHNRVHLDMVHRAQMTLLHEAAEEKPSFGLATSQAEPKLSVLPEPVSDDDAPAHPRSCRSAAPSPKEQRRRATAKAKNQRRLQRERNRRKKRNGKVNGRFYHDFRDSRVGAKKKEKRKRKQKGH
ncbi:hypothetical protein Daus18300_011441 [Diaporthe australafricana]|uniref:Uncharacterized protein n=1 Tax=Diaporthe australafricana TaxID=127596 RepID=A0ABR3W6P1_9PEZI